MQGPGSASLFARGGMFRYSGGGSFGDAFGGLGNRFMSGVRNFKPSSITNVLSGSAGFYLSSALSLAAGQGENIAGAMGKTGKNKAALGAGIESGVGTAAAGLALTSQIAPLTGAFAPVVFGLGAIATGIYAWNNSLTASKEAIKEFEQNLRTKAIEEAADKTSKTLGDFDKNPNNIAAQKALMDAIIKENNLRKQDATKKYENIRNDSKYSGETVLTEIGRAHV